MPSLHGLAPSRANICNTSFTHINTVHAFDSDTGLWVEIKSVHIFFFLIGTLKRDLELSEILAAAKIWPKSGA